MSTLVLIKIQAAGFLFSNKKSIPKNIIIKKKDRMVKPEE